MPKFIPSYLELLTLMILFVKVQDSLVGNGFCDCSRGLGVEFHLYLLNV